MVVRTNRDAYVAGEYVEISGFVTDQGNRSISTFVEIAVFTPENTSLTMDTTHSDSNGYFFTLLTLQPNASLGTYLVTATAEGPSAHTTFKVALNSIICLVNSSFTYPAMPVLIYGFIYPARSVELLLQFSINKRNWQTIEYVNSNSSGYYSFDWTAPSEAGNYTILASYGGTNSTSARLRVIVKEATSIWLSLSSSAINLGQSVRLQGILNSTSRNATVTIQYKSPKGAQMNHTVQADPEGVFEDAFRPDKEGIWTISASWPGDALNQRTTSMEIQLVVNSPPPTMLLLSIVAVEDVVVLTLLARQFYHKRTVGRQ